jgi:hypothetical protein
MLGYQLTGQGSKQNAAYIAKTTEADQFLVFAGAWLLEVQVPQLDSQEPSLTDGSRWRADQNWRSSVQFN